MTNSPSEDDETGRRKERIRKTSETIRNWTFIIVYMVLPLALFSYISIWVFVIWAIAGVFVANWIAFHVSLFVEKHRR